MLLLLAACVVPEHPSSSPNGPAQRPAPEAAPSWTVAIWMDGDNDLEALLEPDLEELGRGVTDDVRFLLQVDRIPGFAPGFTGTRRVELQADGSPLLLEDLGEADMGDGAALADFLGWVQDLSPTEHLALVFWNHGGGFWIASDDSSGSRLDLTGEVQAALDPVIARRGGPLDLVAFDACNMGEWEVASALTGRARVLTASQAWVGDGGYAYDRVFPELPAGASPAEVGDALARSAGVVNLELTHAAIDLDAVPELDVAVASLADALLASPAGVAEFRRARDEARGLDPRWDEFWMDLGDFADRLAEAGDPQISAAAVDVRDALEGAVLARYAADPVGFASGLTLFTDTSEPGWLRRYASGPWAETGWDRVLEAVRATEAGNR